MIFSRLEGRRALLAGWLVGTSSNLAIFYWLAGTITRYGAVPPPLALGVLVLFATATGFYTAVFAWGFGQLRRAAGASWPFAIAAWFCALEYLNPQIFAYFQGVAWYQVPRIFLLSAITGVSGVTFLVILCNAVVVQAIELAVARDSAAQRALTRNAATCVLIVVAAVGYSSMRIERIARAEGSAESLHVAVVQPNHTIERRYELNALGLDAYAADMVALSRGILDEARVAGKPIDVLVWPEGALRADPTQRSNQRVIELVRETGREVWTGGNHHELGAEETTVSHNAAFRILADGSIDRRYDKNILVPFGEYVPLEGVVPGFDKLPTVADFTAGHEVPTYTSGPARFVFLICYEAIRSGFVRRVIGDDVNLIVNVTVDAWYGDTSEQSQHLMLAAAQSALNGIPLVRSTSTGISAIVDASGRIVASTGNFTREALVGEIRPVRVPSLYSRWGDWFAWLCVAASLVLLSSELSRRRRAIA